jgi:hypothetical protein
MRYSLAAAGVGLALAFGPQAFAGNPAWGDAANGNGLYHESNGAATGWGTAANGNGLYHESNGAATGWGTAANGNGLYHESNGAATGWGTAANGNGLYHESNGSARNAVRWDPSESGISRQGVYYDP